MGTVIDKVKKHITNGEIICANTCCDHLLVSDTSNFGGYALINAMLIEAFALFKTDKTAFISLFPSTFGAILDSLHSDTDIKDFLHTQIGVLVTTESFCAKLLEKYQIRDGITKKVADTVDGISLED